MHKKQGFILFCVIPLIGFVADFITKQIIITKICVAGKTIEVFPFFNIVCILNKGVSFGMFANVPRGTFILLTLTVCILIFIHFLLYKEQNTISQYGYSFIIAGAYGNIVDRFLHGGVIDFLDFYFKHWHYPAFNVADSLIFIGVCTIIFFGRKNLSHHP